MREVNNVWQWAKIIIVLERTYSRNKLLHYQEGYSVSLDGSKNDTQRGIMVISANSMSRAFTSRACITRWKVNTICFNLSACRLASRAAAQDILYSCYLCDHRLQIRGDKKLSDPSLFLWCFCCRGICHGADSDISPCATSSYCIKASPI